jgi:hypothetical protein
VRWPSRVSRAEGSLPPCRRRRCRRCVLFHSLVVAGTYVAVVVASHCRDLSTKSWTGHQVDFFFVVEFVVEIDGQIRGGDSSSSSLSPCPLEFSAKLWNTFPRFSSRQEVPSALTDAPDDLQDMPDGLQETLDDTQDNSQVGNKMTFSWRDLSYNEDVNTLLLDHFCRRGTSDKDPSKPARSALLQLVLKNMVASGKLVIIRFDDGAPILIRGHGAHVSEDIAHVGGGTQETSQPLQSQLHSTFAPHMTFESQSQPQLHAQQTPTQLALEDAKLAKLAYVKATRIAQERTQEAAQEAERIKQDATADSRKARKEERYRATMARLGKLPHVPRSSGAKSAAGSPARRRSRALTTST